MAGRILYRGVTAGDSHPLAVPLGGDTTKTRPPSIGCEETLDPRIQDELEKLNKASEDINRLELQLNEARARFRQTLTESTQMLNIQAKKLGSCIEKARPYYDARIKAKEAQTDTQNAALRYERAFGQLAAAKEMVYLAEEGFFNKGQPFDPAWQEMLNHATIKVNDAEKERYDSQIGHQITAQLFAEAEQKVKKLQKELRRNIAKSRSYFEMKAKINQQMEEQKLYVGRLETQVLSIKKQYSTTLSNLERISDEIHHQRRKTLHTDTLGKRGVGVGAESPDLLGENDSTTPSPNVSPTEGGVRVQVSESSQTVTVLSAVVNNSVQGRPVVSESVCVESVRSKLKSHDLFGSSHNKTLSEQQRGSCSVESHASNSIPALRSSTESHVSNPTTANNPANLVHQGVVLRKKPRTIGNESELRRMTSKPPLSHRTISSPPDQRPGGTLPMVQVIPVSASAPTSPIKPDPAQDLDNKNVRDNAELMETIRFQKSKPFGLRPSRSSQDDLLESDTESLTGSFASASMLDDDQVQSLMLEMGEYTRFLDKMDTKQAKSWKRLSLPAKLTEVQKNFNLDDFLAEARIMEETEPVLEETDPVLEEIDPVLEEADPVLEETDPILEETDPVMEETDDPFMDEVCAPTVAGETDNGANRAPIAPEEDDLSFEFIEREDEDVQILGDDFPHENDSNTAGANQAVAKSDTETAHPPSDKVEFTTAITHL